MGLTRTIDAAIEPITTLEARKQVELPDSNARHDDYLDGLIKAARKRTENFTGRAWINQTFELVLDGFPSRVLKLPRPPLQSVTSIKYIDTDGVLQTLSNTLYIVGKKSQPGRISPAFNEVWPTTQNRIEAVIIEYVAGFGLLGSDVPDEAVHAMKLLIGNWFENRESVVAGTIATALPLSLEWILRSLKPGGYPGEFQMTESNAEFLRGSQRHLQT